MIDMKQGAQSVLAALLLGFSVTVVYADTGDHDVSGDEAFITAATQGGLDEIELSKVAARSGSTTEVRNFAAKMVQDHGENNAELARIATAENIATPVAPDSDHMQLRDKLAPLKGVEFDKVYIDAMRADHQKMVDLLVGASTTVGTDDLRAYIKKTLPVVRRHLKLAQDLKAG